MAEKTVNALFTAYYPANNAMEGGLYDAQGHKLDPSKNTCAAPKSIPFGTKIKIMGTGTSKDGQIYTVTDRGGAITVKNGVYHFDLLMSSAKQCNSWGRVNGKAVIGATGTSTSGIPSTVSASNTVIDKVVAYVKSAIGSKYSQANRWATGVYDCSSLVYRAWQAAGVKLVHKDTGAQVATSNTEVYAKDFNLIWPSSYSRIGKSFTSCTALKIQAGDVIFYKTMSTSRANGITHVAQAISSSEIVQARNSKYGVTKNPISYGSGQVAAVIRYRYAASSSGNTASTTSVGSGNTTTKEITSQITRSVYGGDADYRDTRLKLTALGLQFPEQLFIQTKDSVVFSPILKGDIEWETQRKGSPGKLVFTVAKDSAISFSEGNAVSFCHEGNKVFYGYVFKKSRDKEQHIKVTCYDQLRYFKNKTNKIYGSMTASSLFISLCGDMKMDTSKGYVLDTKYKLPARIEENRTCFDIMQTAIDLTLQYTGNLYYLYDYYGKACLGRIGGTISDCYVDSSQLDNIDYETSIDDEVYNRIMLYYDDGDTGQRRLHIAQDQQSMNRWGILQYVENVDTENGVQEKAKVLLSAYNKLNRKLKLKGVIGNLNVRAGAVIVLRMELGDLAEKDRYFIVEKATHTFSDGRHTMDLTVIGGEFTA